MPYSELRSNAPRLMGAKVLTLSDVGVLSVATGAATVDYWGEWFAWVPPTLQFIVAAATVIFVVSRAVNEVRKLFRPRNED